jgi:hypothetical protein
LLSQSQLKYIRGDWNFNLWHGVSVPIYTRDQIGKDVQFIIHFSPLTIPPPPRLFHHLKQKKMYLVTSSKMPSIFQPPADALKVSILIIVNMYTCGRACIEYAGVLFFNYIV